MLSRSNETATTAASTSQPPVSTSRQSPPIFVTYKPRPQLPPAFHLLEQPACVLCSCLFIQDGPALTECRQTFEPPPRLFVNTHAWRQLFWFCCRQHPVWQRAPPNPHVASQCVPADLNPQTTSNPWSATPGSSAALGPQTAPENTRQMSKRYTAVAQWVQRPLDDDVRHSEAAKFGEGADSFIYLFILPLTHERKLMWDVF